MKSELKGSGLLLAGIYAWMAALFLGAILLDITYANLLRDMPSSPARSLLFSEVSDLLLLVGAITVATALGALAAAWRSAGARVLLLVSLLALSLEFVLPLYLAPFLQAGQNLAIGPWLRLVPTGLVSLLALAALLRLAAGDARPQRATS